MALQHCEPGATGSNNCFIVAPMTADETANEMCDGAMPADCWTFAHSRDSTTDGKPDYGKLTPCMVPMIEKSDCPEGELCVEMDPEYVETFKENNLVIPIGASIVCQVKGQTFMRGLMKKPQDLRKLQRTSELFRLVLLFFFSNFRVIDFSDNRFSGQQNFQVVHFSSNAIFGPPIFPCNQLFGRSDRKFEFETKIKL